MDVEFDRAINEANFAIHGVALDLDDRVIDDDDHIVLASICSGDSEDRYKAVGMIDGKL